MPILFIIFHNFPFPRDILKNCPAHVRPIAPDEVADIVRIRDSAEAAISEIRRQKDEEILAVHKRKTEETQAIYGKYTGADEGPQAKKPRK